MKITVIAGKGIIGRATAAALKLQPIWYDPALGLEMPESLRDVEYLFICVPTNEDVQNGGLDHRIISNVIQTALDRNFEGYFVIRSTCEPYYLEALITEDVSVIYFPEFLTERNATEDAMHPDRVVIGSFDPEAAEKFENWLKDLGYASEEDTKWIVTDLASAALIKLGANSFLATKVAMFNIFCSLSHSLGADWETVREGIIADHRIGESHTQVPGPDGQYGYGGKCFPKDMSALANTLDLETQIGEMDLPDRSYTRVIEEIIDFNDFQRRFYHNP